MSAATLDLAGVRLAAADCRLIGGSDVVVEHHASIDSTSQRLRDLVQHAAPPEGSLVVAAEQTAGRGRLGRTWTSPPGGLYLSLLLRPEQAMLRRLPATLLGAVAVAEAIEMTTDLRPELKWPNDVLVDGKKVAGILGELTRDEGGSVLILGLGVNVASPVAALPDDVRNTATSLAAHGAPPALADLLRPLLTRFEEHYLTVRRGGGVSILSSASARMPMLGREVKLTLPERTVVGIASGLNQTGGLVVEHSGQREVFVAGEVEEVRRA
jgi:BirA family biotin operon repressor/biotin-[acetyl-CoA-carboxylase] ligase